MSRKDYEKIAAALQETRDESYDQGGPQTWETIRNVLADVLAADNPQFDRDRFILATENEL